MDNNLWDTIIRKGSEVSTWAGVATVAALVGINLSPELAGAIGQALAAVFALLAIIYKEKK